MNKNSGKYKMMLKNIRHENGEVYLVPSRWYLILLMAVMFIADTVVVYSAIGKNMYESNIIGIVFSVLISFMFTAGPSMIVSLLTNRRAENYTAMLQEYINEKEAVVNELEEALKINLQEVSQELYNEAVNELKTRKENIKMKVRKMIAEYLADPDLAAEILK